mgnify:FL=1
MLRLTVLLLLLANGLYFAWSQGLLQDYGLAPAQQSEPQRLSQQLHPERIRLLSADELKRQDAQVAAAAAAQRSAECLQAGLFTDAQVAALRPALGALPSDSWVFEAGVEPARWIVYMGKYTDNELMNKKLAELRGLNIRFEPLTSPALGPGLSLGGFPTEVQAKAALDQFAQRGVRTARVVQERAETRGQWLKFPQVDAAFRQRLEAGKASLLGGSALRACPKPATSTP